MTLRSVPRAKASTAYKGTRVLVLGANGFIGRWVARKLTEAGAELALVVRDRDVAEPVFERYGVRGIVHAADLMQPGSAAELVKSLEPQLIFNLVGYGVDRRQREEKPAWRLNYDVVRELAIALAAAPTVPWPGMRFVHVGTAAEYGSVGGDLREDGAAKPTSAYGRSKLHGTTELLVRADMLALRAVCARLFTVYGPGEIAGRLLPTLIAAAREGKPVELTDGVQKRDFTYVEDAAEGLLRLGLAESVEPQVVNVATGKLASVRTFALNAAAVLGLSLDRLRFGAIPTTTDEMEHGDVNVERLRSLVGWVPSTAIPEGVARTRELLEAHG